MQHQRTGPAAAVVRTKQNCISICNAKTQGMQQLESKRNASAAVRSQGARGSFLSKYHSYGVVRAAYCAGGRSSL